MQRPSDLPLVQIQVPDTRLALSLMADRFYGRPSRHLALVGVTGTNGKTTVSYLVEALLSQRGPAGLLGTVEQRYPGERRASMMTTPESVELQAALAEMYAAGVKGVVMEVSSHALEQHRVAGCRFDAAVFTNLSRDHLDYHGDMDSYFQAKRRLFSQLLPQSKRAGKDPAAVICADDPKGSHLAGEATGLHLRTLTYGFGPGGQGARRSAPNEPQRRAAAWWTGPPVPLRCPPPWWAPTICKTPWPPRRWAWPWISSPRRFSGPWIRCPACPAVCSGCPERPATPACSWTTPTATRPWPACWPRSAPDPGRLICVFGAGGDRDQGKRPLMGQAVGIGADLAVLTSDNPRSEDPHAIMAMVEPGLKAAGARRVDDLDSDGPAYVGEPNRAAAIALAIEAWPGPRTWCSSRARGTRTTKSWADQRLHFDDCEQAALALARRGGKEVGHAGA